jgi:cell division transport system permease protein
VLIGFLSYGAVLGYINEIFPAISGLFEFLTTGAVFSILIPFSLALGVFIGSIGSVTSVRRHLHV